jgi:RNA polymerase sigma-70 factor (ECF subfamily)
MLDPASQSGSLDTNPGLPRRHSLNPSEQPDLLLIERARGGSEQAVEALMRRYARRLFRVARSVVSDDEGAESAVRDACVAAFGDLSRYEPTGKFAAWLTRLVYQQARSARQSGRARAAAPPAQGALVAAIEQLPEVFRTVFVLRVIEGISGIECAACLGIHETTIRTRLYRAHRRLDAELVRGMRLPADLIDLPAGAAQRLVDAVLAQFPREAGAAAAGAQAR